MNMDAAGRPLLSAETSSEFLPFDDVDLSVIGRKLESVEAFKITKRTSSASSTGMDKLKERPSKSPSEIPSKTSITKKTKKNKDPDLKSKRELTAMEIWSRNANKDFGKLLLANKSKKTPLKKGSKNNSFQEITMTVGAGAGPLIVTKPPVPMGLSKGSSTLTTSIPTMKLVKKKPAKKWSKTISVISSEELLTLDRNDNLVLKETSSPKSSSGTLTPLRLDSDKDVNENLKAKEKKSSRGEMTVQEVEEIIGKLAPAETTPTEQRVKKKKKKNAKHKKKTSESEAAAVSDDKPVIRFTGSFSDFKEDEKPVVKKSKKKTATRLKKVLIPVQKDESSKKEKSKPVTVEERVEKVAPASGRDLKSNAPPAKVYPPLLRASKLMDMTQYLARVQSYFDQLGYHRVGEPQTIVNTRLSIKHLMSTSKVLIKLGQPIKCLHALILAVHFTNQTPLVERFPIHFKSKVNGKEYKHVVLGVYVQGHFGALGISRDPGLQDKPAIYPRLSELINSYYQCYNQSGHVLKELKLGQVITHDPHSLQHITWKMGKVSFDLEPSKIELEIEKISRKLRSQMGSICLKGLPMDQGNTGPPALQHQKIMPNSVLDKSMLSTVEPYLRHTKGIQEMRAKSLPPQPHRLNKKDWRGVSEVQTNTAATLPTKTRTRPYKTKNQ